MFYVGICQGYDVNLLGIFQELDDINIPRIFTSIFLEYSSNIPIFLEYSRNILRIPGIFQEYSRNIPGIFPSPAGKEYSRNMPGIFLEYSFPGGAGKKNQI